MPLIYKVHHVKYPFFLSDINQIAILLADVLENQTANLFKIRQVGTELFHGRTDKVNNCFSRFYYSA